MLSALVSDLRSVLRALRRARGFTGLTIVTLGFGLALCITALTVANAYLLRTLPYPAADRLYSVRYAAPGQEMPDGLEALDWPSLADAIEQPIAWDLDMFYVLGGAAPGPTPGAWVTPGFMQGFGIRAAMGRGFGPEDFAPGRPQVALISHALWQRRYYGDPAIAGRQFRAYVSDRPEEAETFTIVGVMPPDFWHLNLYTEVFVPLRAPTYPYVVRLRAGVTPEHAAQRISALVRSGATAPTPGGWPGGSPEGWRVTLTSAHAAYVAQVQPVLLSIGGAAVLVLLIACANVAVLLLVRASRREKEMAVRLALGASRGQLARLLILEGLVLGGAATIAGIAASRLTIGALAPTIERQLGRTVPGGLSGISIDLTVLLGASAAGLITTALFVLMPLIASWRTRATLALPGGTRGATDAPARQRARTLLIALEVAGSLALLGGAALMVESALRMLRVDFGLRPEDVLTTSVGLRQRSYPDAASRAAFYERLLPGVEEALGVGQVAFSDMWSMQSPTAQPIDAGGPGRAGVIGVSADYFAVLGIPLRDGRFFTAGDRLTSPRVAIVSRTLARRLWPDARAVGQQIRLQADEDGEASAAAGRRTQAQATQARATPTASSQSTLQAHLVVGVVGDVRQTHTDDDFADVYVPFLQRPTRFGTLFVRVAADNRIAGPGSAARAEGLLRDVLTGVDALVSLGAVRPMQAQVDQQRARPRFLASLLTVFAGFAGLLALVGMYGAIAYAVRQREREIAVRMAIGADRPSVIRLFLRQGTVVLGAGLILGLGGALATGRLLEAQLYGVRPGDPVVLALTTLGFGACGLLAIWWPARRAAATDLLAALKD